MSSITLLLVGVGGVLYYIFVLRRFNALGFRLFSLFTFIAVAFSCWIWQDEKTLSSLQKNGEHIQAMIVSKEKISSKSTGSPDNAVTISFTDNSGKDITQQTHEYISEKEWEDLKPQSTVDVIYDKETQNVFVAQSLERFKKDKWVLYIAAGVFFLIGCTCWFFLRNYKVKVDDMGNEWVEKDGKIYLDERKSKAAQVIKRGNILSKFLQMFK